MDDYERNRNGKEEHVTDYSRMQNVRGDAPPGMKSVRRERSTPASLVPVEIGGQILEHIMVPSDAKTLEGNYTTGFGFNPPEPKQGERYVDTDKVVIDGILFDENTEFMWQDPDWMSSINQDFPEKDYVRMMAEGEMDEDQVAEETGLQQYYHFKAGGPMGVGYRITGDGDVQIFPKDTALGRIPLFEKDYSGHPRFVHDDEIAWRQKGETSYHGQGGMY